MKTNYRVSNGKTTELKVSPAVAKLLADFEQEDKNAARKERWRKEMSLDFLREETGWEPADETVNIEADYIASEEKETLLAAVAGLSDKQRRLVQLRYYEEKTVTEIAAILGIHHSNVVRQLETITNSLKKYFEKLL